MRNPFARNIGTTGRLVRGGMAVALLVAGALFVQERPFVGAFLLGAGAFVLFEALPGWCALCACGIKTKL
ncbi:MAG: DUF2892 domain-containing protein [Chthoniobacterales bacterium]|nr:DUF2892 domain-containing protein [Chthoniobacterales bacterium]